MKKHILSALFALIVVLGFLPGVRAEAATVSGDWEYDVTDDGDASIVAYHGTETDIVIPDTLDGLTVMKIATKAFKNRSDIKSVILPEKLTTIGWYAFQGCGNLKSVTLPLDLEIIGEEAFDMCASLETIIVHSACISDCTQTCFGNSGTSSKNGISVIFTDTVTRIPKEMFFSNTYGTVRPKISSVTIGKNVESIGSSAFMFCSSLKEVIIPEDSTLKTIGTEAFRGCSSLQSIVLPEKLETIYYGAFQECSSMESITVHSAKLNTEGNACFASAGASSKNGIAVIFTDTVTYIPAGMFYEENIYGVAAPNITSVTINKEATSIGYNAFRGCSNLKEVVIPEDSEITYIGESAFKGCLKLRSILLPEKLETIYYAAFQECSSLENITVHSAKLNTKDSSCFGGAGASNKNGISVTFTDTVTYIPAEMFYETSYGVGAPNITSVIINKEATSIGYYAFHNCSNLKEVVIPEDSALVWIGQGAFYNCANLRSILLPEKLETIYSGAFSECTSLENITVHSANLSHFEKEGCFYNAGTSSPNGITVTFSDTVTKIPARMFAANYVPDIRSVTVGNSVKVIGVSAFSDCSNLSEFNMPETAPIETIGASAFAGCSSLPEIVLTDALTSIGSGAFRGCKSLAALDIYNYFCEISMDSGTLGDPETTVVRGYGGSAAYQFAQKHGHRFYSYISRIYGAHRYETSIVVADQMKDNLGLEKFDSVILATGNNFADALSGSYLANVKTAPILLTSGIEWVDDIIEDYVRDNVVPGGTVYILGDTSAVPSTFDTDLDGFVIKRLAGKNRFDTNLMILEEAGIGDEPILVCTGLGFADSLSASASRLPILLVWNSLTEDQHAFLEGLNGNELYIIGGPTAVNETVEAELTAYGEPTRLGGKNRFETSVLLAEQFFENPDTIVLAYAWNFPDGLCGGPLAVTLNAPLILTMDRYEIRAADYVQDYDPKYGIILGGTSLVSDHTVQNIYHFDPTATFPRN